MVVSMASLTIAKVLIIIDKAIAISMVVSMA
jgi:hypothetical protein